MSLVWVDGWFVWSMIPSAELDRLGIKPIHPQIELCILGFDAVEPILPITPLRHTVHHHHIILCGAKYEPSVRVLLEADHCVHLAENREIRLEALTDARHQVPKYVQSAVWHQLKEGNIILVQYCTNKGVKRETKSYV